ncbi:site-specific integrase [Lutibacter maritimus]|uniref:Site-specific recombinase XerD n=1 Tax=Lutibacter maritimus TaxID=593133 RepID=A0A1I6SQI4_9FLAO|nr:site-specific integrase [Lutibacter maritimus]SFS79163.1 Site-specific recombinase XerD [Lutibacter maritimus]
MANVTLRQKSIANEKSSLYLDYFPPIISPKTGKETRREFLKLTIHNNPTKQTEKQHNKTTIEFAEIIRAKRLVQIRNKEFGFKENIEANINFVSYYSTIVEEYLNKGSRNNYLTWKASFAYFKKFIGNKVSSKNISIEIVKNYRSFLLTTKSNKSKKSTLSTNSAASYYKHFIYVLKRAFKEQIINSNLAQHAEYIKEEQTFREYLTEEELVKLWNTEIKFPQIKRAALFSAMTGLRFVDIKNLTWETVYGDIHQGYYIKLKEQKTGNIHNHPISNKAYEILLKEGKNESTIFKGLEYSKTARFVKIWIEDAKIYKKISFHNFRHSYATLQLANGTDIYTVSKLLGHKNVNTTQIYTKVLDKNKIAAANRINLDLNGL